MWHSMSTVLFLKNSQSRPAIVLIEERTFCSFPNFKQWLIYQECILLFTLKLLEIWCNMEEIRDLKSLTNLLIPTCSNVGNLLFWFLKYLLWDVMVIVLISVSLKFKASTIIFTLILEIFFCRWPYTFSLSTSAWYQECERSEMLA